MAHSGEKCGRLVGVTVALSLRDGSSTAITTSTVFALVDYLGMCEPLFPHKWIAAFFRPYCRRRTVAGQQNRGIWQVI